MKEPNEVYIYGTGAYSDYVYQRMADRYTVIAFVDRYKDGKKNGLDILHPDKIQQMETVIISVQNIYTCVEIYKDIYSKSKTIYWYWNGMKGEDFLYDECIDITTWGETVLPRLDIHLSDRCNLNCVGCTHYSPLFDEVGCSEDTIIGDLEKVLTKFSNVARLNLLGGEPLLNKNLENILVSIRGMFPNTSIVLFTNGILVPALSASVLKAISKLKIKLYISEYTPTHRMKEKIQQTLEYYKVQYSFSGYEQKLKFNKPLARDLSNMHENICMSDGCISLRDGKIARCPTLLYVFKLNEEFQCRYPESGIYDLNDSNFTGSQLLKKLKDAVPLCDYCIKNEIEWHTCGKNKRLEDFVEV